MQPPVDIVEGESPVLLCQPHAGRWLLGDVKERLNETGIALADTDWHVDRLYDGLLPKASVVRARFHRYVIDANRPPEGGSLYPGQNTTGLCPLTDFDGKPIYKKGQEPDAAEIERRRVEFHEPYHSAIEAAIARVKAKHGVVLLYDCHSIRSAIPFLFEGELPVFNIGTNNGETCGVLVENAVVSLCKEAANAEGWNVVVNGRFKGGWTTRFYGKPAEGVHAIQMELAQRVYMRETPPWEYLPEKADRLRKRLRGVLERLETLAASGRLST